MGWFRNYSREWFTSNASRSSRNPGNSQGWICKMKGDSFNNARMKLLMETVFLKKFGSTRINYQAEKYFLTMGNLPLAAISLPVKGESEDIVLVSNDRQEKSAFSIKPVADKVFNKLEGTCFLKQSDSLMASTSLFTGNVLVQRDL